jgi:hypothetical protein
VLAQTIVTAKSQDLRLGVDSKGNKFEECRAIVQLRVPSELYDWFFNARTGYRAQYWTSAENGLKFNERVLSKLRNVLAKRLPEQLSVRQIGVSCQGYIRCERDVGETVLKRAELLRSLKPSISKIWIGEHLIRTQNGPLKNIWFPTLCAAEQSSAKLSIPRWANVKNPKTGVNDEGLRAPLPDAEYSWLDLKGGFLDHNGNLSQIKPQDDRAKQIRDYGWT